MQITFGKYAGKSLEYLVLKEPEYVAWIVGQQKVKGPFLEARNEIIRLIRLFDAIPFTHTCRRCGEPVTRILLYWNNAVPEGWCDECDPYSGGAVPGKLTVARTYLQAIAHITDTCDYCKSDYKEVIELLAAMKGLPRRFNEKQAIRFFEVV